MTTEQKIERALAKGIKEGAAAQAIIENHARDRFISGLAKKRQDQVFEPHWPEGLEVGTLYRVPCDDKGRNGGSWLQILIAEDGDVYVSMQDWEDMPEGQPDALPGIRIRTLHGGGRNQKVRQVLLWLAAAIKVDTREDRERGLLAE